MKKSDQSHSRRGIYILPSLFTTAGLFAGFFGIIAAVQGNFTTAAVSIFVAMIMDGLDGRIARLTNTESAFGAEYDSLADMVSFGMAPAIISFIWSLQSLGEIGWFGAFLYAAATALRLARFNTQIGTADKKYFQGLPSPAAAALIAGMVWAASNWQIDGANIAWLSLPITVLTGVLMVSNVRYYSFKKVNFKDKVPFVFIAILALIIGVISVRPAMLLFTIFFVYTLSGPLLTLWQIKNRRNKSIKPVD